MPDPEEAAACLISMGKKDVISRLTKQLSINTHHARKRRKKKISD
jgi:hypothetical protein